jgi:5'-3' exonuclease
MKTTLIDMMNIIFIEYYITNKKLKEEGKEFNEENLPLFYHMFFSKMNYIFSTYGKLIICWEGKGSTEWRKSIFPGYKANREANRSEDAYKVLISTFPTIEETLNYYPCKQIRTPFAEGDDMIYSIAKKYSEESEDGVLILSTDKDLTQIKNSFKNIEIYNPIRREFIKENPYIIEEKSICGDASDGIPGLYRIGPKKFEKMLEDKNEWNKVMKKDDNFKIYSSFKQIIDLSNVPEKIKKEILDEEEKKEYNLFQPDLIELFYFNNNLNSLNNNWNNCVEDIARASGISITRNFVENAESVNKNISSDSESTEIDDVLREFL